jgi:lysophospholipase L1-like esterase
MTEFVERFTSDAFVNQDIAKQVEKDLKINLKISPHPFCSWRSYPDQKLKTIETNRHGFRSKKLNDYNGKNYMLLGGSVAWGFGATSNDFIPSYLIEKNLNEKDNVNVINLADQMYSSVEEVQSFVSYLDEINPKLIITLTGTNDINRAMNNRYKYSSLHSVWLDFFAWGNSLGIIREQSYIKRFIKLFIRNTKIKNIFKKDYFNLKDYKKDKILIKLFKNKIDIINTICEKKNIKVLHCLQPDICFKKNRSSYEEKYYSFLKKNYDYDFIISSFNKLKDQFFKNNNKDNISYKDLTNCFDDCKETIFFDRSHVSNQGNKIISKKITDEININFSL